MTSVSLPAYMLKLGFLATHPIQYHAPLYRELAKRDEIDLTVYFCHRPTPEEQGDGFGVAFEWDVDLLSGYRYQFLDNISPRPTVGFFGYDSPEIGGIINRERFDWFIVQGWNNKACRQAFRACRRSGTKLGVRSDSPLPAGLNGPRQRINDALKRVFYPLFMKRFALCLPYGQLSAEYFRRYGGKKIVISPHFVDNNFFFNGIGVWAQQRDELRGMWHIPDAAFCFVFCGKFQQIKRSLDILHALKLLIKSFETPFGGLPVHLLMVGDGEQRSACEALVSDLNLPVTFTGFLNQNEVTKAYAVSDCLILASESETWGLVVNEAMACGLPVIVSDACGCVPDLIVAGETGYSFPCGDVEALADRMRRMATDQEGRRRMSEGARQHISSFSVERAADTLLKAILDFKF